MPAVDFVVTSPISTSVRAQQVSSMFDVPPQERAEIRWHGDVPLDARPWNVGLIVGPSGAGKASIMRQLWGCPPDLTWSGASVVDDFPKSATLQQITDACSAVGFNTIPAWLRPYAVLSNGEKFRVDLARRMVELPDPIVVDEFTSVVDRQVAQIGSHAVQKHIRRQGRKFVAVTCHYDVIDWLQPDWILEPATMTFTWRAVQPRPRIEGHIQRVPYDLWRLFAPYHYMSKDLNKAARCFAAFVKGRPVAFTGVMHVPHPINAKIKGISRTVTLPDWQGLGLSFILNECIGSAYKACGFVFRNYPAHPAFIRSHDRSPSWVLRARPIANLKTGHGSGTISSVRTTGGRPCATFEYCGPAMPQTEAIQFLQGGSNV